MDKQWLHWSPLWHGMEQSPCHVCKVTCPEESNEAQLNEAAIKEHCNGLTGSHGQCGGGRWGGFPVWGGKAHLSRGSMS
jgi:Pyruvate/2-oxoacid:ferredoxin oxidoreductase delta subunit